MTERLYIIEVRPEHRAGRGQYWRPDGKGYTDELHEAGVFTESDSHFAFVYGNPDSRSYIVTLPSCLDIVGSQDD